MLSSQAFDMGVGSGGEWNFGQVIHGSLHIDSIYIYKGKL